jgi:alkylresorcinol/alkylpyrone synthase
MTATTYFTSANQAARHARGAPRIAGTAVAFTPHRHNQDEVARELTEFAGPGVHALCPNGWSRPSQSCATAVAYPKMTGFTEASNA